MESPLFAKKSNCPNWPGAWGWTLGAEAVDPNASKAGCTGDAWAGGCEKSAANVAWGAENEEIKIKKNQWSFIGQYN